MIKIAVTPEAFAAVEATLPLGTVGVEPKPNERASGRSADRRIS
jgi:hypothetical protein